MSEVKSVRYRTPVSMEPDESDGAGSMIRLYSVGRGIEGLRTDLIPDSDLGFECVVILTGTPEMLSEVEAKWGPPNG